MATGPTPPGGATKVDPPPSATNADAEMRAVLEAAAGLTSLASSDRMGGSRDATGNASNGRAVNDAWWGGGAASQGASREGSASRASSCPEGPRGLPARHPFASLASTADPLPRGTATPSRYDPLRSALASHRRFTEAAPASYRGEASGFKRLSAGDGAAARKLPWAREEWKSTGTAAPADDGTASSDGPAPLPTPHELPRGASQSFPAALYAVVNDATYDHTISWLPHGKGFLIHDRGRFEAAILPAHFDGAKFASFARRLRRWKFERVSRGSELGAYYHPDFVRGRPESAATMAYPGGEERETRGAAKGRGGAEKKRTQGWEAALEREVERKVRQRLRQAERGVEAPDRASAVAGRKRPRPDRDPRACDLEVAGRAADPVTNGRDSRPLPLPSALPKRPKRHLGASVGAAPARAEAACAAALGRKILAPAAGAALPPGPSEESVDGRRLAEFERQPSLAPSMMSRTVGAAAAISSIVAPPSVTARHASAGTPSVPTFGILRNDRPLPPPAPGSPSSQRMLELERTRRRLEAECDRELLQWRSKMPRRNSFVIPNEAAAKFGGRALLSFGALGASAGAATDRCDGPLCNDAFATRTAPNEGGAASARTAHAGSGNAPALRSRDEERAFAEYLVAKKRG